MRVTNRSSMHVFERTAVCCRSISISPMLCGFRPTELLESVLRLPKRASLSLMEQFVGDLLKMLVVESISGRLWIVEAGRIRVTKTLGWVTTPSRAASFPRTRPSFRLGTSASLITRPFFGELSEGFPSHLSARLLHGQVIDVYLTNLKLSPDVRHESRHS